MLGLVVNPVAGVGGPAGLAGSDGDAVQRAALARGAEPRATARAAAALAAVAAAHPGATVLTAAGAMGEDAVRMAGLTPRVVYAAGTADASAAASADAPAMDPTSPRRTHALVSSPHETACGLGEAVWVRDAADTTRRTSAADTTRAVAALAADGATLILFAGGDGTARDVASGLAEASAAGDVSGLCATSSGVSPARIHKDSPRPHTPAWGFAQSSRFRGGDSSAGTTPADASSPARAGAGAEPGAIFAGVEPGATPPAALGVPAGVKMYSPVFAVSPQAAGAMAAAWLAAPLPTQQREVLDVDEAAMRHARVEPHLYAMMTVPYRAGRTQARKAPTPTSEHAAAASAARAAARMLRPGVRYLLGPGSTMAQLAQALGIEKSPLGMDVVLDGEVVVSQASEHQLLAEVAVGPAQAVVTIVGGQGFLLGRGNQQLSAAVLRALGPRPLIVVAPEQKLIDLHGRPLLVDTGDSALDARLAGFVRVVTGAGTMSMYPVEAAEVEPGPAMEDTAASVVLTPESGLAASVVQTPQPEGALHAS